MAQGGYSKTSVRLGWLIAILYLFHSMLIVTMPRTAKELPMREELRGWHYLLGTVLLVLVLWRLFSWWRDGKVAAPTGLPAGAHVWGRALALATYLLLAVAPVLGYLYGWSDGLRIHLADLVALPALVPENYRLWMFTGYFHSGLGFMTMLLNVAALLTAGYTWLRYRHGLLSALPPGYGALVLLALCVTSYAMVTFQSPEPGPRAVATFLALVAGVGALGFFIHRGKAVKPRSAHAGAVATGLSAAGAAALIAVGSYGPHALFKVTPWPMGEVVEAADGVTSHAGPVMRVSVTPSTPFEQAVKAETYKWCVFCHTMDKGGEDRVGPNLYAIFGQRAGTVPNFYYTPELTAAGRNGLIWTDETIAAYIADPQGFIKGTTMIISSGPIPDPKVQQAVVNLLKRDTMKGAIDGE